MRRLLDPYEHCRGIAVVDVEGTGELGLCTGNWEVGRAAVRAPKAALPPSAPFWPPASESMLVQLA